MGITINFKKCCNDCTHLKIYTDINELHSYILVNKIVAIITTIGCEHENVCKEYRMSDSITRFNWVEEG